MGVTVTPHLRFQGRARAALDFYGDAFEGEQTVVTYAATGLAGAARSPDDVIWGEVSSADGFRIMAFDVRAGRAHDPGTNGFFVALSGSSAEEVGERWAALAEGGTVLHPLGPSAWSPLYGMLTDRFGVTWIVGLAPGASG